MLIFRVVFAMALVGFSYTFWRMSRCGSKGLCLQFLPASFATLSVAAMADVISLSLRRVRSRLLREMAGGVRVFRRNEEIFGRGAKRSVHPDETSSRRADHVLMVGPMESGNVVRSALLGEPNLTISIVADYRELWTIPAQETFDLVVLNVTLSTFELEASSRLIRQRWPHAKILVIRHGEGFLEDALYDDRVRVGEKPEVLRGRIGHLLIRNFERSRQDAR
jgi:hypothetical protein